jgi:plasminogen activator inhibitor 1 RNA-binding protein
MNIFSVLDDSDNDEPVTVKAPEKVVEKKVAVPKAPPKVVLGAPPKEVKGKDAKSSNAKPRAPKPEIKDPKPETAEGEVEVKDNNRGGLPKGNYKDRPRPKREGGEAPGGKREYDRRSGTGRGREVSRGGRGAFGLGNDKQDALEAEKDPKAADVVTEAVEIVVEEAVPEVVEEPKEPEIPTYTMDQFMEKRNAERAKAVTLLAEGVKVRTVDKEAFTGLTVAGENLDDFLGRTKFKAGDRTKDQRSTGKTQILDVGFKFAAPEQPDRGDRYDRGDKGGRGGEGGRGGGRGGDRNGDRRPGGRGEGRGGGRGAGASGGRGGGRGTGPATVFNTADFPTL